jgi:transposase
VTPADRGDGATGTETLIVAQANLLQSGSTAAVEELVADKGYHDNRLLAQCAQWQVRTYIPERKQKSRRWTDKPEEYETAFRENRRRVTGAKGKRLNRWRSERCERTFAHVCETGGGRRSHLRGLVNVTKSHVLRCAAFNLGLLLRKLFGMSKPRTGAGLFSLILSLWSHLVAWIRPRTQFQPAKHSTPCSNFTERSISLGLGKHPLF